MVRRTAETYPRYECWLQQDERWPSESGSDLVHINMMVPRYATSARDKLIRWAHTFEAQVALNIADSYERLLHVSKSPLAQALLNQAASRSAAYDNEQDRRAPAPEVTPRQMILAFVPIIAEQTTLDISTVFKLAEALATKIDNDWTVTVPSR